jgi:beta-glucosidase
MSTDGLGEKINEQGVTFYNNLINFMIEKGGCWFT